MPDRPTIPEAKVGIDLDLPGNLNKYFRGIVTHDKFYWRLIDDNGRIVGDGSEGYVSKSNLERAILNVVQLIKDLERE